MTATEIDQLIWRIAHGKFKCIVDGRVVYIVQPTLDIKQQAQQFYDNIIEKHKFNSWISPHTCKEKLIQLGLYNKCDDESLNRYYDQLANLKVRLFHALYNYGMQNRIRQEIKRLYASIDQIYQTRHMLDYVTLEGYANILTQQFILTKTTYDECGNLFFGSDVPFPLLEYLFKQKVQKQISIAQYRQLARCDQWRLYWNIGKPNPFNRRLINLTDEQQQLILYSRMYDQAYENPDCPPRTVIEDDDMFDGWLIDCQRKLETERKQQQVKKHINPKHENAQEIFLMANSKKDVEEINSLNDMSSRMIKHQRQQIIKQKGKVKDSDLPDRKLEIIERSRQQFLDHVRSNV